MAAEHSKHYRNVKYFLLNKHNALRRILRGGNMNIKKLLISTLLSTFLLSLVFSFVAKADTQKPAWRCEGEGIKVNVYTPHQAYPNDTITITVIVEATKDLKDIYVAALIAGSKSEGYGNWTTFVTFVNYTDLPSGNSTAKSQSLKIPPDVDPGLIHSYIRCRWTVSQQPFPEDYIKDGSFSVTYLRNRPFEEVQLAYSELNAGYSTLNSSYNSLNASYNELESKHLGELGNTTNLMYVFVVTTVVSAASAVFFLIRRPKKSW